MVRAADTIAAPATPVGTSALAIVRASGPLAARLAEAIFPGTPLPRQARHGDYRDQAGVLLDDVVCVFFPAPNSYTGDDILELELPRQPVHNSKDTGGFLRPRVPAGRAGRIHQARIPQRPHGSE